MMRRVKIAKVLSVLTLFISMSTTAFGQVAIPPKVAKKDVPVKQVPVIQQEKTGPAAVKVADPAFKKFNLAAIQGDHLNLTVTRLPLETLAIEVKKVVDQPEKGEFESTTDYEVRKKAALSISFLGGRQSMTHLQSQCQSQIGTAINLHMPLIRTLAMEHYLFCRNISRAVLRGGLSRKYMDAKVVWISLGI